MEVNECNIEIIFKIKIQINRSEFSKILNACTQTVTGCVFSKLHWIPNLKVMTGNYMIKKAHKKGMMKFFLKIAWLNQGLNCIPVLNFKRKWRT